MKPFYVAIVLIAGILAALTGYYRSEPDTFYGIADTKEIVINWESPVEVSRILVAQGQIVQAGDTLLELHSPDLEFNINKLTRELGILKTRNSTHATLTRSELRQLRAQQAERVSEIRAEIRELEAQYNLNRQLISELRSLQKEGPSNKSADEVGNPLIVKIESLKKLLELALDPSKIYVDRLNDALSSSGEPLIEEEILMERDLASLQEEKKSLLIRAQISGLIGSVNFKAGENVSPFAPILTLHAASPSFVRGYIHEDVMSKVAPGQKVMVRSGHDKSNQFEGEIVGVGTRIVEYPERLRKRPDIQIWGREIMVRLPSDNRFLLGEKVLIALLSPPGDASSHSLSDSSRRGEIRDIRAPSTALAGWSLPVEVPGVEASGILFLPDLGKFLVVSDETKHAPDIFLMDTAGRIEKELPIRGLDAMDDMESIAVDSAGGIYLLSSLNRTKSGNLPEKRTILAKVGRKGESLQLLGKVKLTEVIKEAVQAHPEADWAVFLTQAIDKGSLDIEGMTIWGASLLLGLKAPLLDGKAVILKVDGIESSLVGGGGKGTHWEIWKTLDLTHAGTGTACGISDLLAMGSDIFIVSSGKATTGSGEKQHAADLWAYRTPAGKLDHLRDFEGRKAEGIACLPASGTCYIAIDNGSDKPSQILKTGMAL